MGYQPGSPVKPTNYLSTVFVCLSTVGNFKTNQNNKKKKNKSLRLLIITEKEILKETKNIKL